MALLLVFGGPVACKPEVLGWGGGTVTVTINTGDGDGVTGEAEGEVATSVCAEANQAWPSNAAILVNGDEQILFDVPIVTTCGSAEVAGIFGYASFHPPWDPSAPNADYAGESGLEDASGAVVSRLPGGGYPNTADLVVTDEKHGSWSRPVADWGCTGSGSFTFTWAFEDRCER